MAIRYVRNKRAFLETKNRSSHTIFRTIDVYSRKKLVYSSFINLLFVAKRQKRLHRVNSPKFVQDAVIPFKSLERHEEGTTSIGDISYVLPAAGELPHQPRVHRSEERVAPSYAKVSN